MGKEENFFEDVDSETVATSTEEVPSKKRNCATVWPHAILQDGVECTIHEAVLGGKRIVKVCEIDGTSHKPTKDDKAFIRQEKIACSI